MLTVAVQSWAAWAPGLEQRGDWERWCHVPTPLASEGGPDLRFLPPLLRRRCSRLSRMMLHVAYAACPPEELTSLPAVFASRYGEITTTVGLLECLARAQPLTASSFTHSVHNAQVGVFSIATKNRRMASALAGAADTFPCAFLEALAMMQRAGGGRTLLVVGDEPLPAVFDRFQEEPRAAYALALVVEDTDDGPRVRFGPVPPDAVVSPPPWPQSLEFLRWLLSDEPSLTLGSAWPAWRWTRVSSVRVPS